MGDCITGDLTYGESIDQDQNVRKKQMNHNYGPRSSRRENENYPAECVVKDWGLWSPCNVSCGTGVRIKERVVWNVKLQHRNSWRKNDNINDVCGRIPREQKAVCNVDCNGKDPICYEIPKHAQCGDNLRAFWYYDADHDSCAIFFEGDCGSNIRNKFPSIEACEEKCKNRNRYEDRYQDQDFDNMQIGSLRVQPIDCSVTDWETTVCNATCGTGYQRKTRKILRQARHGGKPCPTRLEKIYKCWVQCPMDEFSKHQTRSRQNERQILQISCEYSNWSPWTPCSKTCGDNGRRQRTRNLLNPENNSRCRDRLQSEVCHLPPCSYESCEGMFC